MSSYYICSFIKIFIYILKVLWYLFDILENYYGLIDSVLQVKVINKLQLVLDLITLRLDQVLDEVEVLLPKFDVEDVGFVLAQLVHSGVEQRVVLEEPLKKYLIDIILLSYLRGFIETRLFSKFLMQVEST